MPTPRIFVSHSHHDNDFGLKLIGDLRARLGEEAVWYDASGGLHGGDEWWRMIVREITERDTFLVILSPQALASDWVPREMGIAYYQHVKLGKKLLPVIYQPCAMTADWEQIQGYDFGDPQRYAARLTALLGDLGVTPQQTPQPAPAVAVTPRERLAQRLTAEVHTAFGRSLWAEVVARSDVLLDDAPEAMTVPLWRERGLAAIELRQGAAAVAALQHALDADPYDVPTLRAMAQAQVVAENAAEAERLLLRARNYVPLDDHPGLRGVVTDLCRLYQRQHRFAEAVTLCDQALRLAPQDADLAALRQQIQTEATAYQQADAARQQREETERLQKAEQERLNRVLPAALRAKGFTVQSSNGVEVIIAPTVAVPAGPFLMGSDKRQDKETHERELPQHTVTLADYRIGTYPLTVAEYACFVQATQRSTPAGNPSWEQQQTERADHPVVNVSWKDVVAYAQWLAQMTGQPWRLPTEAEWEKAARGTDGRIYPWGNAWDKTRANTYDGGPGMTTPVGSYPAGVSPCGADDLAGNVWEWCSTLSHGYPYKSDDGREDMREGLPERLDGRVLRGGAWPDKPQDARAAFRLYSQIRRRSANCGARLVVAGVRAGSS